MAIKIKILVITAIIFTILGVLIGNKIFNKPDTAPQISQNQSNQCKVTKTVRTNADGSKDEITDFLSTNTQNQTIKTYKYKADKNNSIEIYKDQISYSYKYIKFDMLDISPSIQIRRDNSIHIGVKVDF